MAACVEVGECVRTRVAHIFNYDGLKLSTQSLTMTLQCSVRARIKIGNVENLFEIKRNDSTVCPMEINGFHWFMVTYMHYIYNIHSKIFLIRARVRECRSHYMLPIAFGLFVFQFEGKKDVMVMNDIYCDYTADSTIGATILVYILTLWRRECLLQFYTFPFRYKFVLSKFDTSVTRCHSVSTECDRNDVYKNGTHFEIHTSLMKK